MNKFTKSSLLFGSVFLLALPPVLADTTVECGDISEKQTATERFTEKFLKAECAFCPEQCCRLILVPDFDTGSARPRLRKLMSRIVDLHPSLVLFNSKDLYFAGANEDLQEFLIPLMHKHSVAAIFDGISGQKIDAEDVNHERV